MADCDITDGDCGCKRNDGCDAGHEHEPERAPCSVPARLGRFGWMGAGGRFLGWWAGMSGMMAMFVVCPCCGQQACANGVIGMGFVGAVLASLLRVRRWFGRGTAAP